MFTVLDERVLKTLDFDKVLSLVAKYAVLKGTKRLILSFRPEFCKTDTIELLSKTEEAYKLLFQFGVSGIEFFDEPDDELDRAKKGSLLTLSELIRSARLLKSSRLVRNTFTDNFDGTITLIPAIAENLYCDQYLEKDILSKVLSDEKIADNASEKLYEIRRKIAKINEQIREKLASFVRNEQKYLQDSIVTIRGDRYVIPVKSEHRSRIKGLVHDQSASGSTVFIEPIEVFELNNQLRQATIEESLEVEEIIRDLSHKIGLIADKLDLNVETITEIDFCLARAYYAYKTKSVKPILNDKGFVDIINGRHPLIDEKSVVPISLKFGKDYNYLLVTGPNTGGKTVTLKLVGLFTLMALGGMFLPCNSGSQISVFSDVFCDVGDEQSIEQSLSTFSSHIKNIVEITSKVNDRSLVLIDEIGAGTDPDEGSALAQAVICRLLDRGSFGIITTHYTKLKEFAYVDGRIVNASMEFDAQTFAPLYKLTIGAPGSSNALEIALRLGIDKTIVDDATKLLSDNKVDFENVIREAEKTRRQAQEELAELEVSKKKVLFELAELEKKNQKLTEERQKFFEMAKADARRIVNEKLDQAEEYIEQIKSILEKPELDGGDIITARTLKNKLESVRYFDDNADYVFTENAVTIDNAKIGLKVYVKSMGTFGSISKLPNKKGEVEVSVGSIKVNAKLKDLLLATQSEPNKKPKNNKAQPFNDVRVSRTVSAFSSNEINVIGKRREEALDMVDAFIDNAVLNNASEIRIVHGKGLKILSSSIHEFLRRDPRVLEFRFGTYSEGENGVTIVKLK